MSVNIRQALDTRSHSLNKEPAKSHVRYSQTLANCGYSGIGAFVVFPTHHF